MGLYIGNKKVAAGIKVNIPNNQDKTIIANGIYEADEGYTGLGQVTVSVPKEVSLQDKTLTANGTYTADTGYDGFDEVIVNVPAPSLQDKTITQNGTYQADLGYDALGVVTVNTQSVNNTTLTALNNGTYTPPSPYTGYSSVTVNVDGGAPSPTQGDYRVLVFDYDGTILKEEYLNQGDTFTLPQQPSHDRLVFEQWITPKAFTNGSLIVPNYDVYIGAGYTTASGQTEFDIQITPQTGKTFTLNMNGTKDWGDGMTNTSTSHTYSNYGYYTIKCNGTTMTTTASSNPSNTDIGIFGQTESIPNYSVIAYFGVGIQVAKAALKCCLNLKHVTLDSSSNISSNHSIFYGCSNLECATLYNLCTTLPLYLFCNCTSLKYLGLGPNVITLDNLCLGNVPSLESLCIPRISTLGTENTTISHAHKVTSISPVTFQYSGTTHLWSVKELNLNGQRLPGSVINVEKINFLTSNVSTVALSSCAYIEDDEATSVPVLSKLKTVNLLNVAAVPVLQSPASFVPSISGNLFGKVTFNVPFALHDTWIHSGNWVLIPDQIKCNFAEITFPNDCDVYINGYQRYPQVGSTTNKIQYGGQTADYVIYNSSDNAYAEGELTNIAEFDNITVSDPFTSTNKLTVATGISGCSCVLNNVISMNQITSGNFEINLASTSGALLKVYTPSSYNNIETTLSQLTGDTTINIPLNPATYTSWTRPNLTSNGILGVDDFAVTASSGEATAYRAVDDPSSSTYWYASSYGTSHWYTFYSKAALKVSSLTFIYPSSYYAPSSVTIQGSNDGETWTTIESSYSSSSSTTGVLTLSTLPTISLYNYYKATFTYTSSKSPGLKNIDITATTKSTDII